MRETILPASSNSNGGIRQAHRIHAFISSKPGAADPDAAANHLLRKTQTRGTNPLVSFQPQPVYRDTFSARSPRRNTDINRKAITNAVSAMRKMTP